jgi:hypothetical protein
MITRKKGQPDVSVVIVSWNAREYLAKCLKTIENQGRQLSIETIVVDNDSRDGSQQMVEHGFPWVRLLCNDENLGFARANNVGIAHATGRYVFLVNSDIEAPGGSFASLVSFLDAHPEAGMAGPRVRQPDGKTQRSCMGYPTLWNSFCRALSLDSAFPQLRLFGGLLLPWWKHDSERQVAVINGCFWAIRRSALEQVGGLDEQFFMYGEDVDFCRRMTGAGWKIFFTTAAEVIHYGGASSSNAPERFYVQLYRSKIQFWQKHHGRLSLPVYRAILILHHLLRLGPLGTAYLALPHRRTIFRSKLQRNIACMRWLSAGVEPS